MRYMPSDIRAARYRAAGVEPPTTGQLPLVSKLPPVIVTRMTKGGVGKTSISVNVAAAMAMMGYRVLVIDADPQASASNLLGIDTAVYDTDILHIGHFLKKATKAPDADLPGAIKHIYDGGFLGACRTYSRILADIPAQNPVCTFFGHFWVSPPLEFTGSSPFSLFFRPSGRSLGATRPCASNSMPGTPASIRCGRWPVHAAGTAGTS